jgi:hypothetical protein
VLRQDDFVRSLVVLEVWRQGSSFGNHQIPVIIAGCLGNRVRLGWGSWLEVLQKLPKFSATLEQPNRDKFPDIWDVSFIKVLQNIDGIYDGSIADPAMGGIYWADLSKGKAGITNPWFQEKVIDSPHHLPCANQGPFTIFR